MNKKMKHTGVFSHAHSNFYPALLITDQQPLHNYND